MKMPRLLATLTVAASLTLVGCASQEAPPTESPVSAPEVSPTSDTRTITDMTGREVEVSTSIGRVVTVGSVPVINSFLFALGEGELIVNGLPDFASSPRHKYQHVFAPQITDQPQTQNADGAPAAEEILGLDPDMVLVMGDQLVPELEELGLTVVALEWRDPTDITAVIDLLGEILGVPERAGAYREYFDGAQEQIADLVAEFPEEDRTTALYLAPEALTRPHLIAEWWITQAGGISVTDDGTDQEVRQLNIEQILEWDPAVIFVTSPKDVTTVQQDSRLAQVQAVRHGRIYSVPIAAHNWGNRTSEQALTVLWAATKLYPEQLADVDLAQEVSDFYADIYKSPLTPEQVDEILAGM